MTTIRHEASSLLETLFTDITQQLYVKEHFKTFMFSGLLRAMILKSVASFTKRETKLQTASKA